MRKWATNGKAFGQFNWIQEGHKQCADRPTEQHLLGDVWETDPTAQTFDSMDPEVCWRLKNQTELDEESMAKATTALTPEIEVMIDYLFETVPALRSSFESIEELKVGMVGHLKNKL